MPGLSSIPVVGNLFKYKTRSLAKRNLMVFLRPIMVRSKEQNDSISADRYQYMHAAGVTEQPVGNSALLPNLGAPLLPTLINGQPPATDGTMAKMPPPAPSTARPGAATGSDIAQPVNPAQPAVGSFRPVQPAQGQSGNGQ